ncbi:MAG: hypothetical protein IKU25_02365 [Clostridia bacterium]|nr:hypothetical protein [Clostridia bacterium]
MITVQYCAAGHYDYQNYWLDHQVNSAGGASVRIKFRNDSEKTIKYIVFCTTPYNRVEDAVASRYSHQNGRLQCTGPINPGAIKDAFWENVWYNNSIYVARIDSVEIEYMDGSRKYIDKSEIKYDKLGGGGCYVATAVYGSYDCPQVWTLRRYRDDTLAATWYGRAFVKTYYAISPTLVKWFGDTEWFKKMWKGKLDRMVNKLNESGVEDTPYDDKQW